MIESGYRRRRLWRRASLAFTVWAIASIASIPAVAQELPTSLDDAVEVLPSPSPDLEGAAGTVNDTITSIKDKQPPDMDGGSGGGPEGDGGGTTGDTDRGQRADGSGRHGKGASAAKSTRIERTGRGNGALTTGSGVGEHGEPYATLAARGTVAAAGRALKMAGPLAPALGLAIVALFVVFGLARGSTKLVKHDDAAGNGTRSYRL